MEFLDGFENILCINCCNIMETVLQCPITCTSTLGNPKNIITDQKQGMCS